MSLDFITRIPSGPVFIAPTLLNSWVNFGAPYQVAGYALHLGIVYIRGLVSTGTVASPIFTLPAGYRPPNDLIFSTSSNGAFGVLIVTAAGSVILNTGSNVYASLNCCFSLT